MLASLSVATAGLVTSALVGCDAKRAVSVPTATTRGAAPSATPSSVLTPSIRRGGVWRVAFPVDPGTLDPYAATRGSAISASAPVYSRLLAYESGPGRGGANFNTVPDVAEFTEAP
ncbi:MAG: hypothetical protein WCQ48_03200, partial [Chloroflexota bacterium]